MRRLRSSSRLSTTSSRHSSMNMPGSGLPLCLISRSASHPMLIACLAAFAHLSFSSPGSYAALLRGSYPRPQGESPYVSLLHMFMTYKSLCHSLVQISRDWFSLDESHHEQLKTPLLNWLAQSASLAYPKNDMPSPSERGKHLTLIPMACSQKGLLLAWSSAAVYRKLCVALSSLSLHLQPTQSWPDWMLHSTMTLAAASCTKEAVYELLVIVIEEASRADLIGKDKCASFRPCEFILTLSLMFSPLFLLGFRTITA